MILPSDHPPVLTPKIGVLITNLGTPDGPDAKSVKRYLLEFLSDRRVVEIPPFIWQVILRGIVLNTRPKKSAEAYAQVWGPDGSPLAAITKAQNTALQGAFGPGVMVDWAMRYGKPSIPDQLAAMKAAGCERILVAPLYPQYCGATTATANDKAFEALAKMRWQPALRTMPPYYDDPGYIDALKQSIEARIAELDFEPEAIVASFHGMPERTLELGDPYHCHCQKTARLVRQKLGHSADFMQIVFQSRFGRAEWLKPYAQDTVEGLPAQGVKNLVMISPGFASDCVETLEELAIGLAETFHEEGGENFSVAPCLNDSAKSIALLTNLAGEALQGWI